eukprot:jgi/Botrbrau1/14509/Bobra.0350s0014.1
MENIRRLRGRIIVTSLGGAGCSMAGCDRWTKLPCQLQRKILLDLLTFPELARVASTCKSFHQVHLERCRADELLLNDAVNAATGSDAVDSVLSYLIGPHPANPPSGQPPSRSLRVPPGASWPDSSTLHLDKLALVISPAHGALRAEPYPDLLWNLQRFSDCHRIDLFNRRLSTLVKVSIHGLSHVKFCIEAERPSHVAPCLGLTYRVCKRLERETGRLPSVATWRLPGERLGAWVPPAPHNGEPQAGDHEVEEAQMALAAFHRWCCRIGSRIPSFEVLR